MISSRFTILTLALIILFAYGLFVPNHSTACMLLNANKTAAEIQRNMMFNMISFAINQINDAVSSDDNTLKRMDIDMAMITLEGLANILLELGRFSPFYHFIEAEYHVENARVALNLGDFYYAINEIQKTNATIAPVITAGC